MILRGQLKRIPHQWQWRVWLKHQYYRGNIAFFIAGILLLCTFTYPTMQQPSLVKDVLFVLDISESMNVPDASHPHTGSLRLQHAKALINAMMADLPCGSRTAVGLFAGDDTVLLFEPLEVCAHYPAMEKVVSQLDTRMRWIGDSYVVRGVKSALDIAKKNQLHLVFVTDADEMPHHEHPRVAELLTYRKQVKGILIGVGNTNLSPVPHLDVKKEITGYWTPEEAVIQGHYPNLLALVKELPTGEAMPADMAAEVKEHLSQLNEALLQQIASALELTYLRAGETQTALSTLHQLDMTQQSETPQDARWILGFFAAVMILVGWFWPMWMRCGMRSINAEG